LKREKTAAAEATTAAEGDDTALHLRLNLEDRQMLRTVLGFMLEDPEVDTRKRKREGVSFAGAVRYSLRHCCERPPEHVKRKERRA